jgi:MFS family permease
VKIAVIPFLFIYYGFYDIAYTPLIVSYPAEIWPYHLGSKGITISLSSTFVALFFNLFVNPIALANIAWKYYIVYCAILVLVCITVWFAYPEMKGRSEEEMAVVFDGADVAVPEHGVILGAVEAKFHIDGDHVVHSKVEAGATV